MSNKDRQYNQEQTTNNIRNGNLFLDNHPSQIHMLMVDKCNARCIMCGGDYFASKSGRKISLEDYKKMAKNLEFEYVSAVCLAGAGDPLLNPDTIPIIEHTNREYPHVMVSVTTNGIGLTRKISEGLLEHKVAMVNISINSATRETFKKVMGVDAFDRVVENARTLTRLAGEKGAGPALQFSFVMSRLNVEELPVLVELAHAVGARSINVMYCRFYPERIRTLGAENPDDRLKNEDSLFFHQDLSDTTVIKARELAAGYGIQITHEPLFRDNAPPQKCTWAYTQLMVGFTGEIYPCGGAEVHFKDKVESGRYDFGNALHEPLEKFWNNDRYQSLRLSSRQGDACLMPECRNCANLMSPNDVRSHIMEWDESEHVWDGEELLSRGDVEGAVAAFEKALDLNPRYARAYAGLSAACEKKGDGEGALRDMKKALELDPGDTGIVLSMGRLLCALNRRDEAKRVYRAHLDDNPGSLKVSEALSALEVKHAGGGSIIGAGGVDGPMVSVIVPTFNRPDMVRDTIRSILAQTFRDFEIVVVNDCGQEIEPIITELNRDANKIVYIRHGRNRGLAAARNTGIMAARGKYIAYLDDDDVFHPDHLQTLVDFLEQGDHRIAYTDAYRAVMKKKDGKYVVASRDVPYSFDFDYDRILWDNFVPVLCFMHEKACLEEVGMFDEKLHTLEDWDLWIRMSRRFRLAHIRKITCEFSWRTDGTTMSTTQLPNFYNSLKRITAKYKPYAAGRPDILKKHQELLEARRQAVERQEENERKKVSIIILCWNQLEYTRLCLESIEKHTHSPHELILVDNGSMDGTRAFLEEYARTRDNVVLILNDKNAGFAGGNNQALEKVTGDYVLFLNNDTVVTKGWLDRMKRHMLLHPMAGMVGPMSNYVAGTQQVAAAYGDDLRKMEEFADAFALEHAGEVTLVLRLIGFCLLVKKEVLDLIGGFDANYIMGNFEDDDLCLRSFLTGHQHIQAGDVFIHHFGSMTFKGNNVNLPHLMKENWDYFSRKWGKIIVEGDNDYRLDITEQNSDQFVEEIVTWGEDEFGKGNLKRAVMLFKRALQIRPNQSRAVNNLGVVMWQTGDAASAVRIFAGALASDLANEDAFSNLVNALEESGRYDLLDDGFMKKLLPVYGATQRYAVIAERRNSSGCACCE